jgi:peptidyl-tRNA hydrolase
MTNATKLKMYILIPDDIPLGHAINSAAHASLACYLKYSDVPAMQKWLDHSFKKVTVKVTREQFEDAKYSWGWVLLTESALDNKEVALAFCPREAWPDKFKTFPLYT